LTPQKRKFREIKATTKMKRNEKYNKMYPNNMAGLAQKQINEASIIENKK
jgi:hypothetical protein